MAENVADPTMLPADPASEKLSRLPAGWRVIGAKEIADHLLSIRFLLLLSCWASSGPVSVYTVAGAAPDRRRPGERARRTSSCCCSACRPSPNADLSISFAGLVAFIGPLLGIAFGFDAISSERAEGTLPRLVSQPIHRDDVINGKFVAGLRVIVLIFAAVMLLIAGVGMFRLGVVPSSDHVLRLLAWFLAVVVYVGFWLALATLCSVVFRRAATAALVAIASWLVLGLFWPVIVSIIAGAIGPGSATGSVEEQLAFAGFADNLSRLSPVGLFQEISEVLLNPETRWLGLVSPEVLDRAVRAPLSFDQSLLIVWPQVVLLVAATVICFAIAYVVFMRQEVRA